VVLTSATEGKGVAELRDAIDRHRAWLAESGGAAERRAAAARSELVGAAANAIVDLIDDPSGPIWLRAAIAAMRRRDRSPESVVREIVDRALRD
ncbi:MAG TPA: hypothetical protein VFU81_03720, partial [Thermomicrobiales bacterium]|nr:hypothetical protein [Thermomicrobiales bacterium]